jgi:hypothetical protein
MTTELKTAEEWELDIRAKLDSPLKVSECREIHKAVRRIQANALRWAASKAWASHDVILRHDLLLKADLLEQEKGERC